MCDQLHASPLIRLFIFASVLYGISAVGSTLYNMYIEREIRVAQEVILEGLRVQKNKETAIYNKYGTNPKADKKDKKSGARL